MQIVSRVSSCYPYVRTAPISKLTYAFYNKITVQNCPVTRLSLTECKLIATLRLKRLNFILWYYKV